MHRLGYEVNDDNFTEILLSSGQVGKANDTVGKLMRELMESPRATNPKKL